MVWTLTLLTSYSLVSYGLPVQDYLPVELKEKMPVGAGNLALAYLATEATGPLRTLLTLSSAPIIAKKWQTLT
eukprot:CAMPEP_0167749770 /NCGR_PEP_ID=MMETSP0110_2-20121227/5606_1 /TAXON_ID=629695 /ORGANISM="Gymnochlora sp., Strain CCMP2014" /LENGTH=72 /DNA_ID=CAMNT_0007634989 /DNA_START=408 /DNA_END=622 /DNA_ORIENTATION=-